MPESPGPDAVVLRFPPGPDYVKKVLQEAKYNHRHHQSRKEEPWFRVSIWASPPLVEESLDETLLRLVRVAGLGGIQIDDVRNGVFWWTTAERIYRAGFRILKDEEDGEPEEHYSVDLGNEPTRESVGTLLKTFGQAVETRSVGP